ncbi:MAG TPA: hypothetical protein VJL59_12900 [Anaerolineales bacterium]|nr:hypothetical protein [Anaerolineales bacterium]
MNEELLFLLITVPAILVFTLMGVWYANKFLSPFARRLFIVMILLQAVIAGLDLLITQGIPAFWKWFLYIHAELNAGTIFASAQLMIVALAAFINGTVQPPLKLWQRLYWYLLAGAFVYLSLDEYFTIHEVVIGLDRYKPFYMAGGVTLVVSSVAAYWFGHRKELKTFAMILGGLAIIGGGGLAFEPVLWEILCPLVGGSACYRLIVWGETLETFGATVVLGGLLLYVESNWSPIQVKRVQRVLWAGGALWSMYLAANLWVLPAVEARFFAKSVQVQYADGNLSLLGYQVSRTAIGNVPDLTLTLYWELGHSLPEDYNVSVHLVERPSAHSVAQSDWISDLDLMVYPSIAWLPGIPVRTVFRLALPKDLPKSRSYWLIVRVWRRNGDGVPVAQSDRPLLAPDTLILQSLPALAKTSPPPPPIASGYHLADSLTLFGYSLPEQVSPGDTLKVRFWWRKDSVFGADPVQFIHLIGKDQVYFAYDQQPFANGFPVSDWPVGVDLLDEWSVTLPGDLPPGVYSLYTGLYEWPALTRLNVKDANGQGITNNTVLLGTVNVVAP